MVMNLVAPSPSRAIACARSCATSVTQSVRRAEFRRALADDLRVAARHEAMRMQRIVGRGVAVDGDEVERGFGDALRHVLQRVAPDVASVAMMPSMVAMFGWIMPAPFAMPVTVMVRPSITTWRDTALARCRWS
jgi:hypothetical protein